MDFRNQTTIPPNIPLNWRDEYVSLARGRERKTIRGEAARALLTKAGRVVEVGAVEARARCRNITPSAGRTSRVYRHRPHPLCGVSAMYRMLCLTVAVMSVTFASFSTSAPAQVTATQIKLTENQIMGFIAAQDDILTVVEKMGAAFLDHASAEYDAELDAVTKKHGFKDLAEFDAVATNISMVMAGINSETKIFTDPQMAIKKEIEDVSSDKSISPSEKSNLLEQLNAAFQAAEPIRFPTNIELVTKYYDRIEVTTIAISDDDGGSASSVGRTISEAK
jgi:hypothetical protein